MRYHLILLAALLAPAWPATAQVTVDLRALDALPASRPATPAPHRPMVRRRTATEAERKPVPHAAIATAKPRPPAPAVAAAHPTAPPKAAPPPVAKPAVAKTATPPGAKPTAKQTAAAAPPMRLPSMAAAPPPVAEIPPLRPAAAAAPPAKPPQPEATNAAFSTGLKISFPPGKADLSPHGADAIKQLVASRHADAKVTYDVVAYATGTPGDPSVARRLSLSRALAVRNALMADGIASTHIYVRAMGSNIPNGPADRVDITLLGGNDPSQ